MPGEDADADTAELEAKFWKAVESDRTMLLGLDGVDGGHARPMTRADRTRERPDLFFTSRDTELVKRLQPGQRAFATFSAKDHALFASVQGSLALDNDRATIDRLWSPFVAAWFDGGKDDPKLALLRFDADHAGDLAECVQPPRRGETPARRRPQAGLQGNVADVDLR